MLTVITGPPCGGKTQYARKHALPGEVIVDFDAIAVELGSAATMTTRSTSGPKQPRNGTAPLTVQWQRTAAAGGHG